MKKLLLVLSFACASVLSQAQTIFWQNFEVTKNVQPAGWSVDAPVPANKGWVFNNAYGTNMASAVATHTYCAFVDDWDNNLSYLSLVDTLKTPIINCSGKAHVFISLSYMFWNDDGNEVGTIAVSKDAGSTWTQVVNFPSNGGWADSALYDISSVAANQANVKVAFTYYNGYGSPGNGYVAVGMGVDNIDVYSPVNYDVSVVGQNAPLFVQVGKPYTLGGTIDNFGGTQITQMQMNYKVTGFATQSQTISGILNFNGLTQATWSMNAVPWTPPALGTYKIKYWADNLNGANVDQNHANDTLYATVVAVDTAAVKVPLFEEVVGQSCYYCMLASPNVDSVNANNAGKVNVIHYHVPYPGPPDYMYSENTALGVYFEGFYAVGGTPQGELDGSMLYPGALGAPNDFSTPLVAQAASDNSPFKIDITSATYDPLTNKYNATVKITAFATFNAGLIAKAAISNDLITYSQDYSADDPPSSFQPPDGTNASGTSDYYWQFVTVFPSVVEDMMPTNAGSSLAAFTPNSTQTLTLSWTKNHPFSLKGYAYDSSATDHLTVFVQTNSAIAAMSIPAKYVFQSASTPFSIVLGMEQLGNGVSFEMYPNPTNKLTNLNYSLDQSQNVNVQVYNMLGEKVYSVDNGRMSAGQHTMAIDCSGLQSGVYFVKFNTDNATTTKRLVIQQ